MTSLVATPDEIAEALSDPVKRKLWDLNVESVTVNASKDLSIQYSNSASRYMLTHTMLNHNSVYLCEEFIKINGGQTSQTKLYQIEEVENRPYHVRVSFFMDNVSEAEARQCIKNLNSLRNFIVCQNRP